MGNNTGRGLFLTALGFLCFSLSDTCTKFLAGEWHVVQLVWFRQSGLVVLVLLLAMRNRQPIFATAFPKLQIGRGILAVLAPLGIASSLAHVQLAETIAMTFVAPFLVIIMGAFYLGEKVSKGVWVATAVGLIGALIIVRPGAGLFHPAIGFALATAVFFAMRQVLGRKLATRDAPQVTLAFTAFVGFILLSIPLPFFWETPESKETWIALAGMALFAALAEFLVIRAAQVANAGVMAPIQYTTMIWATLFGWLVFRQFPDQWTFIGTGVIVASGIYIIRSETKGGR